MPETGWDVDVRPRRVFDAWSARKVAACGYRRLRASAIEGVQIGFIRFGLAGASDRVRRGCCSLGRLSCDQLAPGSANLPNADGWDRGEVGTGRGYEHNARRALQSGPGCAKPGGGVETREGAKMKSRSEPRCECLGSYQVHSALKKRGGGAPGYGGRLDWGQSSSTRFCCARSAMPAARSAGSRPMRGARVVSSIKRTVCRRS